MSRLVNPPACRECRQRGNGIVLSMRSLESLFHLRSEVAMERTPLLPLPEGMLIDQIQATETSLLVAVISTHPTSCCPLCWEPSSSIHSHYSRAVADVPCGGRQVQLSLTVRKFFCRNPLCQRKVFDLSAPAVSRTVGENDDPVVPIIAIHRSGHLWKRRCPTGSALRHPIHPSDHPSPDYGFTSPGSKLGPAVGDR